MWHWNCISRSWRSWLLAEGLKKGKTKQGERKTAYFIVLAAFHWWQPECRGPAKVGRVGGLLFQSWRCRG